MKKYGGHDAAAGLSIEPIEQNIQLFRKQMQEATKQQTNAKPVSYFISELPIYDFPNHLFDDLMALEPLETVIPNLLFEAKHFCMWTLLLRKNREHVEFFFQKASLCLFTWSLISKLEPLQPNGCFIYTSFLRKTRFSYQ